MSFTLTLGPGAAGGHQKVARPARPAASHTKVCAFYNKKGGCRHGDNCHFLHEGPGGGEKSEPRPGLEKRAGHPHAHASSYLFLACVAPGGGAPNGSGVDGGGGGGGFTLNLKKNGVGAQRAAAAAAAVGAGSIAKRRQTASLFTGKKRVPAASAGFTLTLPGNGAAHAGGGDVGREAAAAEEPAAVFNAKGNAKMKKKSAAQLTSLATRLAKTAGIAEDATVIVDAGASDVCVMCAACCACCVLLFPRSSRCSSCCPCQCPFGGRRRVFLGAAWLVTQRTDLVAAAMQRPGRSGATTSQPVRAGPAFTICLHNENSRPRHLPSLWTRVLSWQASG